MNRTASIAGERVPVIGQGTWQLGERRDRRAKELAALQQGIDLGLTLIDTAEMYGEGASEELVAEAIVGRRDQIFLVTKVLPSNASQRKHIVAACEASLRRLRTDRIDLYLLHWRSGENLPVVVETFNELAAAGKIRHWGVSNFDVSDMNELRSLPGGDRVACNQVLYNVTRRGIEFDLLPQSRDRALNIMAYTPIEPGRIQRSAALSAVAARHSVTAVQVALAWVIRRDGVIAIPRTSSASHVKENAAAIGIELTAQDLADIDAAHPPPEKAAPLEMI